MKLAIEILGGGPEGLQQFRTLLGQAGIVPFDPVEQLRGLLAEAGPGGFGGALVEQMLKGSTQTVAELLRTHMPTNALERLIVKMIEEQFGLNIPLPKLAESLVAAGQLIAPKFPSTPGRDPAAQSAAALIREFALANRFLPGPEGGQTQDPAITSVLKAIRDSEAKTLQELLSQPQFQSILADDSPMGRFIALLRDISFKNPNLTLADLQGFLFGGPGFEAVDVVDATNNVLDAVNTTNAILLGATDAESIQIWKALLTEWKETAPKIADATAMSAEQLAALLGEAEATTENTGQTAENTAPATGTGAGLPGAPGTPGGPPAAPPRVETIQAGSWQEFLDKMASQLGEQFSIGTDPADKLRGALTLNGQLTDEQKALITSMGEGLKAEDQRKDIVSESERAIRDELEARRALTEALRNGGVPPSQTPVPVGATPGSGSGGGSGGPHAQSTVYNQTFNVNEAFNAQMTAAEVQQRVLWVVRKQGG